MQNNRCALGVSDPSPLCGFSSGEMSYPEKPSKCSCCQSKIFSLLKIILEYDQLSFYPTKQHQHMTFYNPKMLPLQKELVSLLLSWAGLNYLKEEFKLFVTVRTPAVFYHKYYTIFHLVTKQCIGMFPSYTQQYIIKQLLE